MKKLLFPFYNKELHNFLMRKWFFRLLIILYIIGILIILGLIFSKLAYSNWGYCYDSAFHIYSGNGETLAQELNKCQELQKDNVLWVLTWTLVSTLIIHYLIQLIFFKIVINFIVLGRRKDNHKKGVNE